MSVCDTGVTEIINTPLYGRKITKKRQRNEENERKTNKQKQKKTNKKNIGTEKNE